MASIDKARSTELGCVIDPELAYDFFWQGRISGKTEFACPDESCGAQTTCANLDRPRHEMKQSPHFRVIGKHSDDCGVARALLEAALSRSTSGAAKRARRKDPEAPDRFRITRPSSQHPGVSMKGEAGAARRLRARGRSSTTPSRSEDGYSTFYSIGPLISRFIRYREEGVVAKRFVRLGRRTISYRDLFIGVYNQELQELPSDSRIYWGVAFVGRNRKDSGFQIGFAEALSVGGNAIKPTIPLPDRKLDEYSLRKPLKAVLADKSTQPNARDRRCFVFVYSRPQLNRFRARRYINFRFTSLDHLDTRDLSFYEELKRSR